MRPLVLASLLGLLLLLAGGCVQEEDVETVDIVATIPWSDGERAEYVLLTRDDDPEELGTGVLTANRSGETFELTLDFEGPQQTDMSEVVVDAETLRPLSVHRELRSEDDTEIVEGTYDLEANQVRVVQILDEEERTIPRDIDREIFYDNESSLFLWRTVRFEEGYEAQYYAVLPNRGGTQQLVTLRVGERREVTVPAGTFDAWRLEIRTSDVEQAAWYADTPERQLVQYDNSRQLFQLTSFDAGAETP